MCLDEAPEVLQNTNPGKQRTDVKDPGQADQTDISSVSGPYLADKGLQVTRAALTNDYCSTQQG